MKNSTSTFRKIIVTFLLVTLSTSLFALWSQKTNLPAAGRKWPATFTIGLKGYIICGSYLGTQFTKDLWCWDQGSDTWTQLADLPGPARDGAFGFEIAQKGYVVMGWDGIGYSQVHYLKDMYEYDATLNSWTQKADLPGIGRSVGMGFTAFGKAYVGMGLASGWNYCSDWYEYDPISDTWTTKASFHTGLDLAACFASGGKGYIVGGYDNVTVKNEVWEYDPSTDTWLQKANFPGAARCNTIGWSLGASGFVGMGTDAPGTAMYNDFWIYNPFFDSWSASASFPGGVRRSGFGFSISECAYMGNGQDPLFNEVNDLWEYCAPTAVNDLTNQSGISITPNPLINDDILYLSGKLSDKTWYSIYNMTGEKIAEGFIEDNKIRMPASKISSEMYLININDPVYNFHYAERVMVEN
jgi:N-acetylneuraminic acid mutarotase